MDKKEKQGQKKNSFVLPFPFLILKDYKCLSKHNATHVAHCSSVYSDLTLHESVPAVFSVPHDSSLRPLTPRTPVFSSPHSLPISKERQDGGEGFDAEMSESQRDHYRRR